MLKRVISKIFFISFVLVFFSCGSKEGFDAPFDGTITFSPTSIEVADAASAVWTPETFIITVKNSEGIPLSNVKVTISYAWAKSAARSTNFVVRLFDDGEAKDSPMEVKTGSDGSYTLSFNWLGGTDYSADFLAVSGSLTGSATFGVDDGVD